jgi:hypothetical protein
VGGRAFPIDDLAPLIGRLNGVALQAARIWLVVVGCAAGGWAIGFAMGYRRGVNDALIGSIRKPDHRLNEG